MADSLQSTLQCLHSLLNSRSPHRASQAAQYASDLYTLCVESVTDSELAHCSAVIFHHDTGVLTFLTKSSTLDEFSSCQEQLLNLLESYVRAHKKKVLHYAVEIKEICNSLFSRNKSSKVKNAVFPPLIAVLELVAQTSQVEALGVPKLADKYYQALMQPTKNVSTVRGNIFVLLGTLSELFPEDMDKYAARLGEVFLRTLKAEMKGSRKPDMPVIAGCLKAVTAFTSKFAPEVALHSQEIYKFTRMAVDPAVNHTRYEVPRAGLSLLANQAGLFKEYFSKDYEEMYRYITHWTGHSNRDNRNVALKTLETFLQQVSEHVVENADGDSATNLRIFKHFVLKFREVISDKSSSYLDLALAVKGYGYFAAPCRIFMKPEDLNYMFGEMVQRTEQLFFSVTEVTDGRFSNLPSFLTALASIVREMREISESQASSLEKLLVLLFEWLPFLPPATSQASHYVFFNIVLAMATSSRATLKTFLTHTIFQGVVISCSHQPVVDTGEVGAAVHLERDDSDILGRKKASYLDYVELWKSVVDPTRLKESGLQSVEPSVRKTLHQMIYDEFVDAVFKISHRLDLTVRQATENEDAPSGEGEKKDTDPPSPVATPDRISGLQLAVPKDHIIFINLVDLCRAVLLNVSRVLFEPWVLQFGQEMVAFSSHHPTVSGFYKLLAICFKICKDTDYFKGMDASGSPSTEEASMDTSELASMETTSTERNVCFSLFRKFVREVLVLMRQYKDDLLASCLQLLLALPKQLVELELEALVPALQMTFKLGLSYLPLAHAGLDALEVWNRQLPAALLHKHFARILPHLDDYLRTLSSDQSAEAPKDLTSSSRSQSVRVGRKASSKMVAKWREGMESAETPLAQLRRRIVFFLGSLGGLSGDMVERGPAVLQAEKVIAWDSKSRLEFALPFQDMKPSIYLDSFLPRVCELATTSSVRQTKIAACELLHALVLYTIGKSAQPAMQKKSPMTNLYKKLFPFLLQLGCDVERVAEHLFRPLVYQMIHWFTRNTQYESPDTIALLDAILDAIVHPTDSALREFSASCIREFLEWSIKQTTLKQQEKSPVNTKSLLKRLYSLAEHPNAAKRMGAAMAINSIYTVFREEESLVDTFVIELLLTMINSLRLAHADSEFQGTREQIGKAVDHLARIICVKARLLSKPNKLRRIPKSLKSAGINNLVNWLLAQCGSLETSCRVKCRQLFCMFGPHVPDITSERVWIRKTVESEGGSYFVSRFERDKGRGGISKCPVLQGASFSLSECVSWLEAVMAALDCYLWVFGEDLLTPGELFLDQPKKTGKSSSLFQSVEFFVSKLSQTSIEEAVRCFSGPSEPPVLSPRNEETYARAKCDVILYTLQFVGVLVDRRHDNPSSCVPGSLWSDDLFQLLALCCCQPSLLGFSHSDIKTMEKLEHIVLSLFKSIKICGNKATKTSLLSALVTQMTPNGFCDLISRLPITLHGEGAVQLDQVQLHFLVSAHLTVLRAGLVEPLLQALNCTKAEVIPKLMASVVEAMKPLVGGVSSSSDQQLENKLSPGTESSLRLLLTLTLEMGVEPDALVNCILDISSGVPGLGLLLFQSFSTLFNKHLLSGHEQFLGVLLSHSSRRPLHVSAILTSFLSHLHKDKVLRLKYGGRVCRFLLSRWSSMASWWGSSSTVDQKLAAIAVLKKMLATDQDLLSQASSDESLLEPVVAMYQSLLGDSQTSLTFKGLALEILHYFTAVSESCEARLVKKVADMIASQFPLKSTELLAGSPQFNEYISCLEKLLSSLELSGSLPLLELVLGLVCRETSHAHEDYIQSSLLQFLKKLRPGKEAKAAIDVSYKVMVDRERRHSPEARKAAGERVCVPFLRACGLETLREFFLDHIQEIMAILEAALERSSVESQLVSKLCCFQFMEVLYSRLTKTPLTSPDSDIVKRYCRGAAKTGKELTQAITKASHGAKSEDLRGDKSHYSLRMQYHCAAYNALIAIISCTQEKPQFYLGFLFKEDVSKPLWSNLVDLEDSHQFNVELEKPIVHRTQLTAIRDEVRARSSSRETSPVDSTNPSPHYLSSQYLADSSLCSDVSRYDFSTGPKSYPKLHVTSAQQETSYLVSEEALEMDSLNQHRCMLPLMKLLDHMQHNITQPLPPDSSSPIEMPTWMGAMHRSFSDGRTHSNVRLFLARLLVNRSKVFQPYAKFWLGPLAQLVVGGDNGGTGLHYFVVDIVVTILSWSTTTVMEDTYLANRLLKYLMQNCSHSNKSVLRNNLEIIKTLVESWKTILQPSYRVIHDHFNCQSSQDSKSSSTGVQLLGIVLANGMPPFDSATAEDVEEKKFFSVLTSLMTHKYKEVYAAAAEVLGLALAYMDSNLQGNLEVLKELVWQRLTGLVAERQEDKFLTCLHNIQLNYNKITDRFVGKLLFLLPNFHGFFRSMCLEVLVPQADLYPQLYQDLKDKGFHDMLMHRDEPTQLAALKLVQRMVQHQTLGQHLGAVMPLVLKFGEHSSEACRGLMYEVLVKAYTNTVEIAGESPSEEDVREMLDGMRDQLLLGLSDDSEAIRLKIFAFWSEESRLSSETLPRLTQLLPVLYSERAEPHFLHHSTHLLLELTSRSPDFNRSLFDSPLSECKFEEYTAIDLSWHQRHLQMTPLFAATQASQSVAVAMGTVDQSLGGSRGPGIHLRATQQAVAFTPTQEGQNWMAPSMQSVDSSSYGSVDQSMSTSSSPGSTFLFKVPTSRPRRQVGPDFGTERLRLDGADDSAKDQGEEILKLKRRFIKDKTITSSFYARYGARKKARREERRKEQRAARDSKVVMYRKYRKGELPDIQIKHSELVRPFQALAQHDSTLARMLFTRLYEAIFQQVDSVLTNRDAEETTVSIKEALNTIVDSSKIYHPPFISSLQEICYRDRQLHLKPGSVSRASLMSMQEPMGVMLLEKQLLCNVGNNDRPRPKRPRTSVQPLPETTATWVELSKLYKSLGDYDAVRGIFSSQVGTKPVTRVAMEAEERGDFLEASHQYSDALKCRNWQDGEPSSVEEDLWDDSLLACYSHLTKWEELEQTTFNNVVDLEKGETLDRFWSNPDYEEHYLPSFIHSKVKLACSGKDDPAFSKFLEDALKKEGGDESKRRILEQDHSLDLALYSVLKENHDRARYYISKTLDLFLNDWSCLDKLLVTSRTARLRVLQPLTELQEYLDFISDSSHFESVGRAELLLAKWRCRYPDPKRDGVGAWDDVVTGRCMMMNKLMDKYSTYHGKALPTTSLKDSQEGVAPKETLAFLQEKFSREFIELYRRLAESAGQQMNYAVAYKYLQLSECAIAEHFKDDLELHLRWTHSVAKIRTQEAGQDPSPPKIRAVITLVNRIEGYADEPVLATSHALAQRHHQLTGASYSLLARQFSEEGGLLMECLSDDTKKELCDVIKRDPSADLVLHEVAHKLRLRAMSSLKAAVKSGTAEHKSGGEKTGMVEALLEMAVFCDRELRLKEDEDIDSSMDVGQYPSVVVSYGLKAMQYGSEAAAQQVPRMLQVLELYPETMDQFVKKSAGVPCWMFISWLSQMIPLLDKPEGTALQAILLAIATDYPQALAHPLKISSCDFKFDSSTEGREQAKFVKDLKQKVHNKLLDSFVAALELLCSPELVVKDFFDNDLKPIMEESVAKRKKDKLEQVWRQLGNQLQDWVAGSVSSLYEEDTPSIEIGHFQKKFAKEYRNLIEQRFGKKGSKLPAMTPRDFRSAVDDLVSKMRPGLANTTGQRLLKDYSPWLSSFQAYQHSQTIEIPGQYGGKSKPLPEYHTKIAGLDEKVLVMSSLRKPKRITLRGDDEKEYMFLVKGGEDLRLDQRIEQLYCVMNGILGEDAACSQRGLYLRTYQVIPMTPRVGLIEWMKHTKPLKDFLKDALTEDELNAYNKAAELQKNWLKKHDGNYKTMYRKANFKEVNEQYQKKVECVPTDILRRAFLQLSSCPEAFLTLRTHCVRTLAALSMCQYVLGIGDRHLSNFMVDLRSGGLIGIDFGHNFGTATQFLPFPELMPFRLTPQFTNLLLPHSESGRSSSGQLRSCMTHTLRALRSSSQILLNTMDVFVKEPALDWKIFARKQAKTQKKSDQTALEGGGTWYPREKIRSARKKLQGYNPVHMMLTDLSNGHGKSQEFPTLKAILVGDKKTNKRAQVGERCITVEEQVACLVDHATDVNILGRTWAGWEPWV